MHRHHRITGRALSRILSACFILSSLALVGCSADMAFADVETEERTFTQTFPDIAGEEIRLANLAGAVELIAGSGDEIVVEAVVHAKGRDEAETRELLAEMKWEEGRDRKGREEWSLTYPVKRHKRFHYNTRGRSSTSSWYRGKRVRVSSRKGSGTPTLYADLRITYPGNGRLKVRNIIGRVQGGDLQGELIVDTGSGSVDLGDFSGDLNVDTGSGDVSLGTVRGETLVDTGSGDIRISELVGNANLDTGSGEISVRKVAMGRLKADTGSGDIVIEDGAVSDLIADTGSGEIQILGVEVVQLQADTGSGDVILQTTLEQAERISVDTGSGDVRIEASQSAAFDIQLNSGSGELRVRYDDALLEKIGGEVVSARRGEGGAQILVDTGSGDCFLGPA